MKKIILPILILILGLSLNSFGGWYYHAVESGGAPTTISVDFTQANLDDWTMAGVGVWTLDTVNDNIDDPPSDKGIITHDTELDTITQYVAVQFVSIHAASFSGVYFRYDGNPSNYAYAVRYEAAGGFVVWRDCLSAGCTTIQAWAHDFDDGDYIGIEVTGTGGSTEVKIWDFGGSLPARGSWGAAGETLTDDPNNDADVGKFVGLYDGDDGATLVTFDNFSAGTF